MASILDTLAADVKAALTGTLHTGSLRREVPGGSDGAGGTLPGTVTLYPFEGVRGSYDAVYAGLSGIPREAAKIEILASSIEVPPLRLDKITIEGAWFQITEIALDPAGSWFVCECADTETPT